MYIWMDYDNILYGFDELQLWHVKKLTVEPCTCFVIESLPAFWTTTLVISSQFCTGILAALILGLAMQR